MALLPFQLSIGARGWLHPAWQQGLRGGFYPEDLPPEWRLDYYANEFRQVLVPADDWQQADSDAIELWSEAVDPEFRFYIELPDALDRDATSLLPDKLRPLDGLVGGLVRRSPLDGGTESASAEPPGHSVSLYIEAPAGTALPEPALPAWSGTPDTLAQAPIAGLVRLRADGKHSPLELRRWCEALRPPPGDAREILLFLDGDPPSMNDLITLKQLAELMC